MTDFRKFYRIIGIAEHIVEPSYYHLLGLNMDKCTPDTVRAALIAKKKELRENIPGREFVPMILKFEREQLEPAAEVLADDQKRARYNKELAEKYKQIKQENQKRNVMLEAVRNAVANALDQNGTLNSEGRQELANVLESLGVENNNIEIILDKIPRPLSETGQQPAMNKEFFDSSVQLAVNEGPVDENQQKKFIDLAKMLDVDVEDNSEIFSRAENDDGLEPDSEDDTDSVGAVLCEDEEDESPLKLVEEPGQNDPQGTVQLTNSKLNDGEKSKPEPDKLSDAEALMLLDSENTHPDKKSHGKWFALLVVPVIIAIFAGLLFLLFAILKSIDLGGRSSRLDQEIAEVENTGTDKTETPRPQPVDDPDPDNTNSDNTSNVDDANPAMNTGSIDDTNPVDTSDVETPPDTAVLDPNQAQPQKPVEKSSDVLRSLAARDFVKQKNPELLADCVLGMLAVSERTSVLTGKPNELSARLRMVLETPYSKRPAMFAKAEKNRMNRKDYFEKYSGPVPAVDEKELDEIYSKLSDALNSSDKTVRYKAIDLLQADGSKRAVEILLGPRENPFVGTKVTVSRRLRALAKIGTNYIAKEIAVRIGNSPRPAVAQQLSLALYDMTGIFPQDAGIIGAKNDFQSRLKCSQWWLDTLEDWQPQGDESIENLFDDRLVDEILLPETLITALTHYTNTAVLQLKGEFESDSNDLPGVSLESLAAEDSNSVPEGVSSAVLFQKATSGLYKQLERTIRQNRRSKNYLIRMDVINLERDAARLVNDNPLQKSAVDLFAAGRLLEIFVMLDSPDAEHENLLEKISQERANDKQKSENILQEIRQQIYHNLRLLELLTSQTNKSIL